MTKIVAVIMYISEDHKRSPKIIPEVLTIKYRFNTDEGLELKLKFNFEIKLAIIHAIQPVEKENNISSIPISKPPIFSGFQYSGINATENREKGREKIPLSIINRRCRGNKKISSKLIRKSEILQPK